MNLAISPPQPPKNAWASFQNGGKALRDDVSQEEAAPLKPHFYHILLMGPSQIPSRFEGRNRSPYSPSRQDCLHLSERRAGLWIYVLMVISGGRHPP